ncbi:MAG: UvrD-helicase domain-containing protein, partial [Leptonema sp. (in: bacteria)]
KLSPSSDEFLTLIAESYQKYKEKLIEQNKVDFAHLQKLFFDLLNVPELYSRIKQKIKYIMVDEYQDTNYIQEQILVKLTFPKK